ncbi:FtsX-like permease family protein [Gorillibacterium sp. sgz5001074]|uniref:ABC transporter permease n=1 Tax=Gorillibacterium sp. sgz5001074 TaxID=3446695 RepID=UPI003F671021
MNNLTQLALRYLKQQKRRSLLTIVGIMLSMALVFSSTAMGEALKDYLLESIKLQHGNYHAAYLNLTQEQVDRLKNNAKIRSVAVKRDAGYMPVRTGLTIQVTGGGPEFLDVMSLELEEGTLPAKDGEIALERWMLENLPGSLHIGDKLKLPLTDTKPGAPAPADGSSSAVRKQDKEVVLTGIFKNKMETQQYGTGMGIVTLEYADALRQGFQAPVNEWDAAVLFKDGIKLQAAIRDTAEAIGAGAGQTAPNTALLTALGEGAHSGQNRNVLFAQAIVIAIIMTATVAVIYNAFHITVLERIKQFGLLRSIGMTPRQIRGLVLREASILAAAGIPAGILLGWGGIEALMALFAWMDQGAFLGMLKVQIHWYIPVATVLIGLATVLISAFGPAYAAGRVSPLEALLHHNRFNKEKAFRSRKFRGFFPRGIVLRMSQDNLKRNRKRYRVTLLSMSIGIVLYVFFTSFLQFIHDAESSGFSKDYQLTTFDRQAQGYSVEDYEAVAAVPGVERVYRTMEQVNRYAEVAAEQLTPVYRKDRMEFKTVPFATTIQAYSPRDLALLEPYLVKGSLDSDRMDADNGVLVLQKLETSKGIVVPTDLKIGDTIRLGELDASGTGLAQAREVKVLGILDGSPYIGSLQYQIITSEKMFTRITGRSDYARFDVELQHGADPEAVKPQLRAISDRNPEGRLQDYIGNDTKVIELQISILLYGLVAAISVISAINIINTISTNLILRTREFGTLRAVGMTMKQMRRMIVFESIWYGIMATLAGGTVGSMLAYWFYSNVNAVQDIPYRFPLGALLTAGIASGLICLMASRVPMKRIERMDIVMAIRAEE